MTRKVSFGNQPKKRVEVDRHPYLCDNESIMVVTAIIGTVCTVTGSILTLMEYSGMIENIPQQINSIGPLILAWITGVSLGVTLVAGFVAIGNRRRSKKETALAGRHAKCETVLYPYFQEIASRLELTEHDPQKLDHIRENHEEAVKYGTDSKRLTEDIASVLGINTPCYPSLYEDDDRVLWRYFLKHVMVCRNPDQLRTTRSSIK